MRKLLLCLCLLTLANCGSASGEFSDNVPTGSIPVLSRAVPSSAHLGDTVTLYGYGFSIVSTENLVILGDLEIPAEDYQFIDASLAEIGELESLSFTIPFDATLGEQTLTLTVLDNDSSNSLSFTVRP